MTDRPNLTPDPFGAGRYEIRLAGRLEARWTAWFDGLTVSQAPDGTTTIAGPVTDQAALHGLLQRVRDLGLPLVSVTRMDSAARRPLPRPASGHDPHQEHPMTTQSMRRSAFVAGLLYLITFISSIPAVFLLEPALTNPDYILGAGATGQVRLGALFDIINCLTAIGTAIALYSVVRRQHGGFAIGFVASRVFEAAC